MIIMPANNTGIVAKELAKTGKIGNLFSPNAQRKPLTNYYALDNGRFISYKNKTNWSLEDYIKLLEWAKRQKNKPQWALVPDVVANKEKTLSEYKKYLPLIKQYGFTPAFAVQDGMTKEDVPKSAKVIFIGGSTEWKWKTLNYWCSNFQHVHVGRVNTRKQLIACFLNGVKSVDGTGWFRGDKYQLNAIKEYCNGKKISLFGV